MELIIEAIKTSAKKKEVSKDILIKLRRMDMNNVVNNKNHIINILLTIYMKLMWF